MKKIILYTISIFCFAITKAQIKKLQFIITSGINSCHYQEIKGNSVSVNKGNVQDFNAGIMLGIRLSKVFTLQSGLLINSGGGKTQSNFIWQSESDTSKSIYLKLPLDLLYTKYIFKNIKIFVGGGFYIAKGISGKNKYFGAGGDIVVYTYSGNKTIHYEDTDQNSRNGVYNKLAPIDYGCDFIGGIQYKKFKIYTDYGLGLKDVKPKGSVDNIGKNRIWSFGIGYTFHL